ncbi:MAG: hypothetical protein H6686_13060 [Fibrobacteria bacterium]|nr:hypothetical protein [Fibrobacteria bacterium]
MGRIVVVLLFVLGLLPGRAGALEYTLEKVPSPNADQADAYRRIEQAMDSAVRIYNAWTEIDRTIRIQYNPDVATADGSSNGNIRFGSSRSYMVVITAMHEIAHVLGVGTTAEYKALVVNGVVQAPKATAVLRTLTGDAAAELHGDGQHIWPYGLNYASEVKSPRDLEWHARIVGALLQDMFQEEVVFEGRVRSIAADRCMVRSGTALVLGDCSQAGAQVRLIRMGDANPTWRLQFGDRVLDTPNESRTSGVVMGTYGWNGGNHQRVKVVGESVGIGAEVRLVMVHSGLTLAALEGVVRQGGGEAVRGSEVWELAGPTGPSAVDRAHVGTAFRGMGGAFRDLRGRSLDPSSREFPAGFRVP